jgi:hypothetical protein
MYIYIPCCCCIALGMHVYARSLPANILMFCPPHHLHVTSCRMRKSPKRWKKPKFQAALSVARTSSGTVVCALLDV